MKYSWMSMVLVCAGSMLAGGDRVVTSLVGVGAPMQGNEEEYIMKAIEELDESMTFIPVLRKACTINNDEAWQKFERAWAAAARARMQKEIPGLEFDASGNAMFKNFTNLSDHAKFVCLPRILEGWQRYKNDVQRWNDQCKQNNQ